MFVVPVAVNGAPRAASVNGNWNSTTTWGGASVPVAGDDVTINAGITVTITANAACASITFSNNSTLTFNGAFTLDVSGTVTMPAPSNNNPITFALGAGTATIGGLFTMNGGNGNAARKNDLTISTGTMNLNGGFTTFTTSSNVIFSGAGVLNISGAISSNAMTLTAGTGTVNYTGSTAQNIWNLSYYNLGISGTAVKTYTGTTALGLSNTLSVASGGTFELSGTGTPLSYTGTVSGTGKVLYSGAGAQTIAGATYYDLEFSGAGTKTIAAGTTIAANNWIVGSATTMTTTAAADIGGDISGSGNITMGSGTINIAGNWTNNGTFSDGTGTVIYDGTTQSIAGLTYYNLQTSNSGVKTLAANTVIDNVLTIGASTTLDLSSMTLNLVASGTPLVNNGTFTSSTSTVNFSNAASTDVPALNYYNLNLSGGPRTLANTGITGIANTFTPGAGAITVTGSTVNFNGIGAQTLPVFTFNDVILSGSGAKTVANGSTVSVRTIEIQNGPTLDIAGTGTLNITN